LQRLFHSFEMTDALFEIGDLRFECGVLLRVVLQRLDHLVEKLIDVRPVVALQRSLELAMLDVYRRNSLHGLSPIRHEIERTVGRHGIAQACGVDHDAGRHDQVDRVGEFLNLPVERVRDADVKSTTR